MPSRQFKIICLLAYLFFFLQTAYNQIKQSDGVIFKIDKLRKTDPQLLKIQICSENIIRVIASPSISISTRPSLPTGPEIKYTSEKPADPIRLFIYTGKDGSFTLYEDEDENVNYNF